MRHNWIGRAPNTIRSLRLSRGRTGIGSSEMPTSGNTDHKIVLNGVAPGDGL